MCRTWTSEIMWQYSIDVPHGNCVDERSLNNAIDERYRNVAVIDMCLLSCVTILLIILVVHILTTTPWRSKYSWRGRKNKSEGTVYLQMEYIYVFVYIYIYPIHSGYQSGWEDLSKKNILWILYHTRYRVRQQHQATTISGGHTSGSPVRWQQCPYRYGTSFIFP